MAYYSRIPLISGNIARRLTLEIERDPATVEALLELAMTTTPPKQNAIIAGMAAALHGWRKAPKPANWQKAAEKLITADVRGNMSELAIVFGDGRAMDELRKLVGDGGADPESRRQALRALLAGRPADFAPVLQGLLGDRAMVVEALRGLAQYDDPKTPERIFQQMGSYSPEARAEMINTLASRPAFALALLAAVRDKKIAPGEISAFHARQIRAFDRADLNEQLSELWGEVRVSAAEKQSLIDQFKTELTAPALAKADLSAGRGLFQKTCANCHVLYGAGRKVGPDLTGSNRKNLDYLLENIVDPSASVGADFRVLIVTLADGRVLSGVVSEQNERTLTLQTQQEPVTLDRKEIEESKQSANSLMPDGQLQNFTAEQIRDLIGYLMSSDQVPLPKP
jgi:putative heme-binding domain-containing protein